MAEDRTTITADASQYFDVLQRAGAAGGRFARTGDEIGQGFLRGDRAVRVATGNIVQGLISANSVADAALTTFQSLERVFKIPIGATIGGAAAIAGVEALRREFEKTQTATDSLRKAISNPIGLEIQLSPQDIESRIGTIAKAIDELGKRSSSAGEKIARFFASAATFGLGGAATRASEQARDLRAGQERLLQLSKAQADNELKIANLKGIEVNQGKEAAQAAKVQLDLETSRAKLMENAFRPGAQQEDILKRFIALQNTQKFAQEEINKASEKAATEKAREARSAEAITAATKLELDGKKDLADAVKEIADTEARYNKAIEDGNQALAQQIKLQGQLGLDQKKKTVQEKIRSIKAKRDPFDLTAGGDPFDLSKGGDPFDITDKEMQKAEKELTDLENLSEGLGQLGTLSSLDFTNLQSLSGFDFSGLRDLDGLSITIQ